MLFHSQMSDWLLMLRTFVFIVEHILATTFPARCVVWDLRKNEPVIKVSDSTSRVNYIYHN